jgi:hypothetical protein
LIWSGGVSGGSGRLGQRVPTSPDAREEDAAVGAVLIAASVVAHIGGRRGLAIRDQPETGARQIAAILVADPDEKIAPLSLLGSNVEDGASRPAAAAHRDRTPWLGLLGLLDVCVFDRGLQHGFIGSDRQLLDREHARIV